MKPLIILFIFSIDFLCAQPNRIDGEWILKEVFAPAIITVNTDKTNQLKVIENENQFIETKQITLREYLLQEMQIGITKFVFKSNKFEFYRSSKLTLEGEFDFQGNNITLLINSKIQNKKELKNVILNENEMTFESISDGYPFIITFIKAN
jgi:hypothetical protein